MDFREHLAVALSDIIKDVEKGDQGRGSESTALRLEVLVETALLNGDISLEVVDLMNQVRQQLYTFSNNRQPSFQPFEAPIVREEGRRGRPKFVIRERQLLFFKGAVDHLNKIKLTTFTLSFQFKFK